MKIISVKSNKPTMSGVRYLVWLKGEDEPRLADYSTELLGEDPCWDIDGFRGDFDDEITHYAYIPKRPRIGKSGEV